jgi:hypothetical protein
VAGFIQFCINKIIRMKKFVIERKLPGAGNLTPEELQIIARTSNEVVASLKDPYLWVESFVTEDRIFCIHEAESEEVLREHAKRACFPINNVYEVKAVINAATADLVV